MRIRWALLEGGGCGVEISAFVGVCRREGLQGIVRDREERVYGWIWHEVRGR